MKFIREKNWLKEFNYICAWYLEETTLIDRKYIFLSRDRKFYVGSDLIFADRLPTDTEAKNGWEDSAKKFDTLNEAKLYYIMKYV